MLYGFQQQASRTISMAAYSIGHLVSEIFGGRRTQRRWNSFCAQRSSQTFDVQNLSIPTNKFL